MPSLWKKIYCVLFGHKTSLFPGIRGPIALAWTYPDSKTIAGSSVLPQQSGIGGIYGVGANVHSLTGPTYELDLCQRCLAIYVSPPPVKCANCGKTKRVHNAGACGEPCLNCGKHLETHFDGKCPFEASTYRGTQWEENTG